MPGPEALLTPDAPVAGKLRAYCHLMQACRAGDPGARPTMDAVVAALTGLLEQPA